MEHILLKVLDLHASEVRNFAGRKSILVCVSISMVSMCVGLPVKTKTHGTSMRDLSERLMAVKMTDILLETPVM